MGAEASTVLSRTESCILLTESSAPETISETSEEQLTRFSLMGWSGGMIAECLTSGVSNSGVVDSDELLLRPAERNASDILEYLREN